MKRDGVDDARRDRLVRIHHNLEAQAKAKGIYDDQLKQRLWDALNYAHGDTFEARHAGPDERLRKVADDYRLEFQPAQSSD